MNVDNMDDLNQIPMNTSCSEDSSVFLLMPDQHDSEHYISDTSSHICMQVIQNIPKWKRKSKNGPFEITSKDDKKQKKKKKGFLSRSKSASTTDFVKSNPKKSLKFDDEYDATEYWLDPNVKSVRDKVRVYHAVSVDTIRDRPCCCMPISDISTPVMKDEGFEREEHGRYYLKSSASVISPQQTHLIAKNQSSITLSVCSIPPCRIPADLQMDTTEPFKPTTCHEKESSCPQPHKKPDDNQNDVLKKPWTPEDGGEQTCNSCGRPLDGKVKCLCYGKEGKKKMKRILKELCPCNQHTTPPDLKENDKEIKAEKETEKGAEKDVEKKTEKEEKKEQKKPVLPKKSCKCCVCSGGKAIKGKKCSCAENTCHSDQKQKERCDCSDPEPKLNIDYDILKEMMEEKQKLDMEEDLKLKSDNTVKVSGFNVKFKKKPLTHLSLDEAIKYFEMHPEQIPEPIEQTDDCVCEDDKTEITDVTEKEENPKPEKKRKISWKQRLSVFSRNKEKCECPDDELEPEEPETESYSGYEYEPSEYSASSTPLAGNAALLLEEPQPKGFKFTVGGKGSGSKGLKGICCFDMLQEQPFPKQSKSSPDTSE